MPDTTDALLVCATFPDLAQARAIGRTLVTERLAACVNVVTAPLESIYTWQGQHEENEEILAFMKTTRAAYPALETRLRALHPYEVPEIIAVPIAAGLPDYLRWIAENCGPRLRPGDETGGAPI
jgi:periplasmic divalent cation tolerance protein